METSDVERHDCSGVCSAGAATAGGRRDAEINTALMGATVAIGTVAIARQKPLKLLLYLPAVVGFMTWWRRFVCARCRYYGEACSTLLGIWTSSIMPRDEERALDRETMLADLAILGVLALAPLPQLRRRPRLAVLYLVATALGMARILLI